MTLLISVILFFLNIKKVFKAVVLGIKIKANKMINSEMTYTNYCFIEFYYFLLLFSYNLQKHNQNLFLWQMTEYLNSFHQPTIIAIILK